MNQQLLAKTFVELADNLVADFDLIDFLRLLTDRCVGMLGASAAGVLLADRDGELRVMAASVVEGCWSAFLSHAVCRRPVDPRVLCPSPCPGHC